MEGRITMWKRCWWATWVSGFFGIAGLVHIARWVFRIPVRLGAYDVPVAVSLTVGVVFLAISAGLLWLEVRREQAKRRGKHESG
jgi:hypothetical protein